MTIIDRLAKARTAAKIARHDMACAWLLRKFGADLYMNPTASDAYAYHNAQITALQGKDKQDA